MTQGRSRLDSSPALLRGDRTVRWSAILAPSPFLSLAHSGPRFAPGFITLAIALRSRLGATIFLSLAALPALFLVAARHATALAAILPILCHRSTPSRDDVLRRSSWRWCMISAHRAPHIPRRA